jgi:hypothetical protein
MRSDVGETRDVEGNSRDEGLKTQDSHRPTLPHVK